MPSAKKVAVMGGEGIGPEVTAQARRVLAWFAEQRGVPVTLTDVLYGSAAYRRYGKVFPPETEAVLAEADAILFGATGGPEYDALPAAERRAGNLLRLRKQYDLFANLRPIVTFPALYEASSLKNRVLEGVDFVIVRELSSGIYFGQPRGIEALPGGGRRGFNTQVYTSAEVQRVARFAFELARTRRGHVCSVDKSNVMEASVLWREEAQQVHDAEFPDVKLTHMLVDNCAMQLVRAPAQFDVLVTCNMFGDILSDCAAMATGSLGMLPSASLGPMQPNGRRAALFEPVHGSAPDIAGQGVANPLGAILSVAMALRLVLECPQDADLLERAVREALGGGVRTNDLMHEGGRRVNTQGMGDAVLASLGHLASGGA